MSVIAVVPARSGSKSIKNKNTLDLCGHPLLAYSIRAALSSERISDVFLSTDSEEYAELGRHYGAKVPFIRPSQLATDVSTDYEWVNHFLCWYLRSNNHLPRLLVHLRPTTPLREPTLIDGAIDTLMAQTAYKCFEIRSDFLVTAFQREHNLDAANMSRHAYPQTFIPNGYVDILDPTFVQENKRIHGERVLSYRTPQVADIDTVEDLEFLEFQCARQQELIDRLFSCLS